MGTYEAVTSIHVTGRPHLYERGVYPLATPIMTSTTLSGMLSRGV